MKTRIKICGITNLDDGRVAAAAGADLLGFIFYEPSPRYAPPETVARIVAALRPDYPDLAFVGVFVNHPQQGVAQIMRQCDLDWAQLHGEEPPEFLDHFAGRAFKAGNPRSLAEAQALAQTYLRPGRAEFLLLDAYHPHLRGGTGHTADWDLAARVAADHNLLLAGGLTPDNVAEAIAAVHPWGVDVSSGVEARKGKKDHDKVRKFVEVVSATRNTNHGAYDGNNP